MNDRADVFFGPIVDWRFSPYLHFALVSFLATMRGPQKIEYSILDDVNEPNQFHFITIERDFMRY